MSVRLAALAAALLGLLASAASPALAAGRYARLSDEWTLTRVATP